MTFLGEREPFFLDFLVASESPKRAVRFCRLRGNRLLFGCALTVSGRADSARPLIGCLDMNIVCRRQCSDQSEARISVTECYGILTCGGPAVSGGARLASTNQNAVFGTNNFTAHSQNKNSYAEFQ